MIRGYTFHDFNDRVRQFQALVEDPRLQCSPVVLGRTGRRTARAVAPDIFLFISTQPDASPVEKCKAEAADHPISPPQAKPLQTAAAADANVKTGKVA